MVRSIFTSLHKEIRGLHEAAYLLGIFAFLSQLLALVRDRMLAHSFGAGIELDLYYAAFRVPDLIFVTIASIVSVYILIPFLADRIEKDPEDAQRFLSSIFTFFFAAMVMASGVIFLLLPAILPKLFPGIVELGFGDDLVLLTRVLLLQPILLGLSNLLGSITQVHQKFLLYAVSPLLYNIGIIIGIIFLQPIFGLVGLVYGVLLGAFMHLGVQLPFILTSGLTPHFLLRPDWSYVYNVLVQSLPRTITLSLGQITLLIFASLASLMAPGSIAVFQFSFNLHAVPLTIIGVSYSVAAFPTLSRLFSKGEREEFLLHIVTAARHIIFWSLPAIALFVVLRAHIVRIVLGSGAFDWQDTRLTAAALALFVVSLAANSLMLLFVRGYYASGNTRTPLAINAIATVVSIASAYLFLHLFNTVPAWRFFFESLLRVDGLVGTEVLMLALGYSLGMITSIMLFIYMFRRDFASSFRDLLRVFLESGAAAVIAGAAAYGALTILDDIFDINTFFGITAQAVGAGIAGIIAGICVLLLLKSKEVREVSRSLHHKFWKERPIAPEREA